MNEQQMKDLVAEITSTVTAQVLARLDLDTKTPAADQPKADAEKSYKVRTDRQKEASHRKIAEVNARWNMKLAGGSRKVSDLSAAERKQYDAEIKACWTKPAGKTVTR